MENVGGIFLFLFSFYISYLFLFFRFCLFHGFSETRVFPDTGVGFIHVFLDLGLTCCSKTIITLFVHLYEQLKKS